MAPKRERVGRGEELRPTSDGEPFKSPKRGSVEMTDKELRERRYTESRFTTGDAMDDRDALRAVKAGQRILDMVMVVQSSGGGGTHGEQAVFKVIKALIMASQTTAAGGNLDNDTSEQLRIVIQNPEILNRVARSFWWGDEYYA